MTGLPLSLSRLVACALALALSGCLTTLPEPDGVGHVPLKGGRVAPLEGRYSCDGTRLHVPEPGSRSRTPSPSVGRAVDACGKLGLSRPDSLEGSPDVSLVIRAAPRKGIDLLLVDGGSEVNIRYFPGHVNGAGYLVQSSGFLLPFAPLLFMVQHELTGLGVTRDGDLLLTRHRVAAGGTLLMMADVHEWDAYRLPREPQPSTGAE